MLATCRMSWIFSPQGPIVATSRPDVVGSHVSPPCRQAFTGPTTKPDQSLPATSFVLAPMLIDHLQCSTKEQQQRKITTTNSKQNQQQQCCPWPGNDAGALVALPYCRVAIHQTRPRRHHPRCRGFAAERLGELFACIFDISNIIRNRSQ